MFWGAAIKAGASYSLPEGSDLLHVSQVCMAETKEGPCQLQVTDNNTTYTIAVLEKGKNEMASLDLFFNTVSPPTFINKGKSELHLTGYFELSHEGHDDDEEMSEEEEEEGETEISNAAQAKKVIAGLKKAMAADDEDDDEDDDEEEDGEEDEEEDDEEDEEDDDEEEDGEDEEEDEEEEDEEEEEEEVVPAKKENNKRPAAANASSPQPQKSQKTEAGSPEDFVKQVGEFIKKNGKQTIAALGSKVTKPASVQKLKAFLAGRKEFKISGDMVSLA